MPLTSESEWAERICLDPSQSLWDTGGSRGRVSVRPHGRSPQKAKGAGHSLPMWGALCASRVGLGRAWQPTCPACVGFRELPAGGRAAPGTLHWHRCHPLLLTVDAGP